jgi:hypothetical protein
MKDESCCNHHHKGSQSEALYCLGVIGAIYYFVSQAVGFWPVVLGIIKAFIWPAFVIFKLLGLLKI